MYIIYSYLYNYTHTGITKQERNATIHRDTGGTDK